MADLLRFRKGLHSALPATKVKGTVYVTTDEHAMYVDISDSERIRLGQIVNFATLTSFQQFLVTTNPPYSQEAFYYIEDKNALLRWKASTGNTEIGGSSTAGTWVQVNSVSDVQASVDSLTQTVNGLTSSLTNLNNQVNGDPTDPSDSGLVGRIVTLEGEMDDAEDRLDAVESTANTNKATIGTAADDSSKTSLYGLIAKAQETANGATNTANGNSTAIAGLGTRMTNVEQKNTTQDTSINNLRADLGTNDKSGSTAFSRIAALEGKDSTQDSLLAGLRTDVDAANNGVSTNQTAISNNAGEIAKNKTAIEGLDNRLTEAEGDIDDLETWKGTASSAISTLQTDLDKAEENITALQNSVSGLNGSLTTLNNTVTQHTTDIKKNADDIGTINGQIEDITDAANTLKGRVDGHDTKIQTIEGNVTGLTNRMSSAEQSITNLSNNKVDKTTYATDKAALEKKIDDEIIAANAMDYKKSVGSVSALPTAADNVKIGYTYVASGDFTELVNGEKVSAGDLLVANGTENADGFITGTITWDVVHTGYIQNQENKLISDGNTLKLQAYTGLDLSSVTFTADGAAKVAVTADATNGNTVNTVKVTVEWEDF